MIARSKVTFVTDSPLTPQRTRNFDQIFNHLYLENEKTFIRIFFWLLLIITNYQLFTIITQHNGDIDTFLIFLGASTIFVTQNGSLVPEYISDIDRCYFVFFLVCHNDIHNETTYIANHIRLFRTFAAIFTKIRGEAFIVDCNYTKAFFIRICSGFNESLLPDSFSS
jgi:hypothetical protein